MELKVWVEGIQRIICGVTENTTCQDIVYALAHATGQTGRFTLIERWRNNERLLAPHEHPLKILNKWGEYSNDVQFVLQRTSIPDVSRVSPNSSTTAVVPTDQSTPGKVSPAENNATTVLLSPNDGVLGDSHRPLAQASLETGRNLKKSLTISSGGGYQNHRVGVVRGVPQQRLTLHPSPATAGTSPDLKSTSQPQPPPPYREPPRPTSPSTPQQQPPPYRAPPSPNGSQSPLTMLGTNPNIDSSSGRRPSQEMLADGFKPPSPCLTPQSAPSTPAGHLSSPSQTNVEGQNKSIMSSAIKNSHKSLFKDGWTEEEMYPELRTGRALSTNVALTPQYKELLRLVNQQREKLTSLQADLTKYDAEIVFWEGKTREQQHKAEFVAQEGERLQETSRIIEDQLMALKNIEEEKEISKQQEKTLKSEITLLRSKLANCETELLQCKIKIRHLLEELQLEQRAVAREAEDLQQQQQQERGLLGELERLQTKVEEAKMAAAQGMAAGCELDQEVQALEVSIHGKKQQVEQLVQDMKEANLHSLAIAPADELRHLLEGNASSPSCPFVAGPHKPGSTRKMIGSPRQLENAVPTSKNPLGVWV